jgi:SMI1/KNR4 family protein SUKH-1
MTETAILEDVVRAWRATARLHRFADPIDEDGVLAAEARLRRTLPPDLARLYAATNGFDGFGGDLRIDAALIAADKADELRDNDWPIARELLVFGGDGSDELFGLWYPEDAGPDDPTPVVEIGSIFEGGNLALAGTTLPRFLRTITAFRLVEAGELAIAAMLGGSDVPRSAGRLAPFVERLDPSLPFVEPDPYVQRLTARQVSELVSRR